MYLIDIVYIMIFTGIFGGTVNYYSDGNKEMLNDVKRKIRPYFECLVLGVAATIIVPFFLKLADSRLVENIQLYRKTDTCKVASNKNEVYTVYNKIDSFGKVLKTDTIKKVDNKIDVNKVESDNDRNNTATDYLLWAAYCLLAAAAGMRFIDLLINKLLTQAQVEKLKTESKDKEVKIDELEIKVQESEKIEEKRKENLQISELEQISNNNFMTSDMMKININNITEEHQTPKLPPIIYAGDPQKSRFGGKDRVNGRVLSVEYGNYPISGFLNLKIIVSSEDVNSPLKGNVYLYLHDSFVKSIIKLDADGKQQVSYEIPSYGAFTVGASTDYGNTLLELDISRLDNFPEDFRNR